MLKLLTKKDKCEANFKPKELDVLLAKIAQIYRIDEIDKDRSFMLCPSFLNQFEFLIFFLAKIEGVSKSINLFTTKVPAKTSFSTRQ